MGTIVRRKATSYSHWLVEWKRGPVTGRGGVTEGMDIMADELLSIFFGRYPSALGNTHAGGQYRIICPECGHIVPVAALDQERHQITVHCTNCGYNDEIGDAPQAEIAQAEIQPAA